MNLLFFIVFCLILLTAFYMWATRKSRRRKKILQQPFPVEWKAILQNRVGFYHTLSEEDQKRFESLVQVFIAEKRIIGIKTEVDDTTRILVAASAIIPVFGFKGWEYDNLGEVFVTQGAVSTQQIEKETQSVVAGQVQPFQNQHYMILSKTALESGFDDMKDRKNGYP
jgi:Mlc titration factor MtfA (ptsG expression regulator)